MMHLRLIATGSMRSLSIGIKICFKVKSVARPSPIVSAIMGGGLLQLVAYGAQDVYLTGNPQITYFKISYRRHTNFAMENIECEFNGNVGYGQRVTCILPRNGDLIGRTYIKVVIPKVQHPNVYVQGFPIYTGYNIIKKVSIEIGGQEIDRQYSEWMYIWNELTTPEGKVAGLSQMVGTSIQGYNRIPGSEYGDLGDVVLYLPLNFWFCRNPGLMLPLIALQYHEVKIHVDFVDSSSKIYTLQNSGYFQLNNSDYSQVFKASLLVDYVFLDSDERRRFAQLSHEYLIEQVQTHGPVQISTQSENTYNLSLTFNHPVKELLWVFTAGPNMFEKFGYIGSTDIPEIINVRILKSAVLKLNGHDRFAERDGDYFEKVQLYQHHTNADGIGLTKILARNEILYYVKKFIGAYSFALHPEEFQVSGTLNFSRIDSAQLVIRTNNLTSDGLANLYTFNLFAHSYNVLRIMSGMGGLAYSN